MNEGYMYAWGDWAQIPLGDHTWVTTYEPGAGEPNPSKGYYWPCYGDPRSKATQLTKGSGGVNFARAIAKPFDKEATAGIRYLKDGVCHQIANRLLRFSLDDKGNPITVSSAKGYRMSVKVWGVYGERKYTNCKNEWDQLVNDYANNSEK